MREIRVLLADDHPMVREGLRASLDGEEGIVIVGDVSNGQEALTLAAEIKPDVVMMDISMPVMNGLEAAKHFKEQQPDIRVLILSMHEDRGYIMKMVQFGVAGYVLKDVAAEELVLAIQTVHHRGTYFSSGASSILFSQMGLSEEAPAAKISKREETVLALIAEGLCNKDIARKLDLSVRTVEAHRQNIKKKLKITTSAGLIRYALDNGLAEA